MFPVEIFILSFSSFFVGVRWVLVLILVLELKSPFMLAGVYMLDDQTPIKLCILYLSYRVKMRDS